MMSCPKPPLSDLHLPHLAIKMEVAVVAGGTTGSCTLEKEWVRIATDVWAKELRSACEERSDKAAPKRIGVVGGNGDLCTVLVLLSTWKAGFSAVPVDARVPWPRAQHCLGLCHLVVVTPAAQQHCASWLLDQHLRPQGQLSHVQPDAKTAPPLNLTAVTCTLPTSSTQIQPPLEDELHVYHTSGTTGRLVAIFLATSHHHRIFFACYFILLCEARGMFFFGVLFSSTPHTHTHHITQTSTHTHARGLFDLQAKTCRVHKAEHDAVRKSSCQSARVHTSVACVACICPCL